MKWKGREKQKGLKGLDNRWWFREGGGFLGMKL